jgi:hypothetical protein
LWQPEERGVHDDAGTIVQLEPQSRGDGQNLRRGAEASQGLSDM